MMSENAALFAELLAGPPDPSPEDATQCLVTGEPLEPNHVTLDCGHKFNYLAMYNELKMLRTWAGRPYDTNYVTKSEIRCPYCRKVTKGVLPYVPTTVPELTRGLNSPQSQSIGKCTCEHILSRRERKGQPCGKAGFMYQGKGICPTHWRALAPSAAGEWTPVHQNIMRSRTCYALRAALKAAGHPISGTKKILIERAVQKKVDLGNLPGIQAGESHGVGLSYTEA